MTFESPPADEQSPDHSTCVNCGEPITWDDVCYVHDGTGFADCGLIIEGGAALGDRLTLDPEIKVDAAFDGMCAKPVEWGEPSP